MSLQAFQTRARTIEHLGRAQIADCPTAVSELWKNAFDAYARHAALHVFHGDPPLAAVFDDGHGMTAEEFMSRWMVIGTESKLDDAPTPVSDRFKLPERPRQGEKGIGRLSAAYLGPVTLVISRHQARPYVAGLVDWRLFSNPFLTLSDVRVPVEEFTGVNDLARRVSRMIRDSAKNLGETDRSKNALQNAWKKFSDQESHHSRETTADGIHRLTDSADELAARIVDEVLPEWAAWGDDASHGTVMVFIEAGPELAVWVDPDNDPDELDAMQKLLQATLTGFVDPYAKKPRRDFTYEAVAHTRNGLKTIVSSEMTFGLDELLTLEHSVVGHVDENGVFQGFVRAFGVDQKPWTVALRERPPKRSALAAGPFDICLGAFEMDSKRSTHPPPIHEELVRKASRYAGLAVYRDDLRVMPYGRPEADYFGIEERRSKNVGRAFWSYRRTFGRVALTRAENPNLRDKAGREGLIDNTARRELQALVIQLLETAARRFFATDSEVNKELLREVLERNRLAREAEKRAGKQYWEEFRATVRRLHGEIEQAASKAARLRAGLKGIEKGPTGLRRLAELGPEIDRLRSEVDDLTAPSRPTKLGRFEEEYRKYRDAYQSLRMETDVLVTKWSEAIASREPDPVEVVTEASERHRNQLRRLLSTLRGKVEEAWTTEALPKLKADTASDADQFPTQARPVIASVEAGVMPPDHALRELEELRSRLHQDFSQRYGELARAIRQLAKGIDLAASALWSGERRLELEGQVELLTSLAQLGVTVEIVGHEFETIDGRIREHVKHLPKACRESDAFRGIRVAVQELFDRLRFFGPLQLSGPRQKEEITGEQIVHYVELLLGATFSARRIAFQATPAFRCSVVREYQSRVVPVFLNLVNNAVYWVAQSDRRREIRFDRVDDTIVVANSGPAIDPDDEPSLFQLFFSRRIGGRGIGLYLCRQNLAAGGHTIDYASQGPCRVLPGANFIIRFQGIRYGE